MRIHLLSLAVGLLLAVPAGAQVVSLTQVQVSAKSDGDGPGWESSITLSVNGDQTATILSLDEKKSSLVEATEASTGQPVKVESQFRSIVQTRDLPGQPVTAYLTITAPAEVSKVWLKLGGTLAFKCAVGTKKHTVTLDLAKESSFKLGEIKLKIKDVEQGKGQNQFAIQREGPLDIIKDIRFMDKEGLPIEVNRRGSSRSSRDDKTIEESWKFMAPADHDEIKAEFEIIENTEMREIPFDIVVPVNP